MIFIFSCVVQRVRLLIDRKRIRSPTLSQSCAPSPFSIIEYNNETRLETIDGDREGTVGAVSRARFERMIYGPQLGHFVRYLLPNNNMIGLRGHHVTMTRSTKCVVR